MANTTTNKKDQDKGTSSVGQMANTIKDKAQDAAHAVADKAHELGSGAVGMADSAASSVGGGVRTLAGTVRDHTPNEGMLGNASNYVADTLDSTGRYLQEHGVSGAAEDVTSLIKRHPVPAVLIGIGLGFLLARLTSSRS